ncbi:DUF4190 domain-containing protein [Vallitalea guaymasensis]|uniref:DUF4190 domain-containing protein n=1 Tax=Vallitalea guaymasensis TaxID=1185412 RepID=UPI0023548CCC|nr:DUF4190 domain-containing protein [Vallitalea guaymasensis]
MSDFNNPNQEVKFKGLSIASMVCGIVGIVFFCFYYLSIILAILAIIFGAVFLNANKENEDKTGRSMAIAGLILGIITVGLVVLVVAGLFSAVSQLNNFV